MRCYYMECYKCKGLSIKHGKSRNGEQRYFCKTCLLSFQETFTYNAYKVQDKQIILLTKEGVGIRSTSRILGISPSTVLRRIIKISKTIIRPYPVLKHKIYQVDELFTYVQDKKNRICIAYSFEPQTGNIVDFIVGRRNKTNLRKVTDTLVLSGAKKINTDKLNIYKELIPKEIHSTKLRGTNHIERNNLTMRTHLKRLNRKTLCYSKTLKMLTAIIKIYFWA